MKKYNRIVSAILFVVLASFFPLACQKTPDTSPGTFASTYYLNNEGRSIVISGKSDVMPGEQSEYILKISNGSERWQDEYCILLIDNDSVIQKIDHEQFDLPGGGEEQKTIMIKFPNNFKGALGLCVIIPQRATIINTLSIGVKDAISTGWPDIRTCPFDSE